MPFPLAALIGGAALGGLGNIVSAGAQKQGYEAALGQYEPLMELMSPEGRAKFLADYAASEEGQLAAAQGQEAVLKGASATGGLRTGQTNVALQEVMPQLGLQALNQRMAGLSSTVPQLAQLESGRASTMGQALGNTMGQIGGLGIYGAQGGFEGLV